MPDLSGRRHVLDYDSAVAMRYHGRRRAFCENTAKFGTAFSLIFGTGAFAAVALKWPQVAATASGIVAVVNAFNLAFGTADAGRRHGELFRRWGELRAELADVGVDDERAMRRLEVKRAKIDAESPTQLEALPVLCENEEKGLRCEGPLYNVPGFHRVLANLVDVPGWQPQKAD